MIHSYARVSSIGQAEEGSTSLEEQTRKNKAVADLRGASAFDFAKHVDAGVSGSVPLQDRPAGKAMLASLRPGDIVVAAKMDRLFRSARDAFTTAEQFKKRGVDLILIDLGVEPVTGNGTGRLFFGILACMAEFERERIGERTADGRKAKKEAAGHIGGSAPYGFVVTGKGRQARLTPVEQEQKILAEAKAMSEAHGPGTVARLLNNKGYRSRTGKPFQAVQMQRIVADRRYGASA